MSFLTGLVAKSFAHFDPPPIDVDPGLAPAVLVHGLTGTPDDFARVAKALQAKGRETSAPFLTPNNGTPPLEELSAQLAAFIDKEVPPDRGPVHLVAHSMGGLVCRHYLQSRGGLSRVRSLITLGTPHRGTWMAYIHRAFGVRQMRPGSEFLAELNSETGLATMLDLPFTSIWTPTDLIIVPASSSVLPVANNICIWGLGHISPLIGPRYIRRIMEALEAPPASSR